MLLSHQNLVLFNALLSSMNFLNLIFLSNVSFSVFEILLHLYTEVYDLYLRDKKV